MKRAKLRAFMQQAKSNWKVQKRTPQLKTTGYQRTSFIFVSLKIFHNHIQFVFNKISFLCKLCRRDTIVARARTRCILQNIVSFMAMRLCLLLVGMVGCNACMPRCVMLAIMITEHCAERAPPGNAINATEQQGGRITSFHFFSPEETRLQTP